MGRPRRFDEETLLDVGQELFWSRGYDRTSMEEIAAASGAGVSSLYAIYGGKLALFLRIFGRYCEARVELAAEATSGVSDDLGSAVAEYLDRIVAECTSHADRRGCLMLNSVVDLGDRFPEIRVVADSATARIEDLLHDKLLRTAAARSVDLSSVEARPLAARVVLASQGLIQLSRLRVSASHLTASAAHLSGTVGHSS